MTQGQRTALIVIGVGLGAFLLGAGWQYLRVSRLATDLDAAERAATFSALEASLAAVTIEAQRGNYELARQYASDFFTQLQTQIGQATDANRAALEVILGQRDVTITALSRSNPQSATMLADIFNQYRQAMGRAVAPAEPPAIVPPAPADSPADTTLTTTTTGS
jgi:hypothetical protein